MFKKNTISKNKNIYFITFFPKLKTLIENYEREKFELQKQHTKAFQDLVDETNFRLKKVDSEYNTQQNITVRFSLFDFSICII